MASPGPILTKLFIFAQIRPELAHEGIFTQKTQGIKNSVKAPKLKQRYKTQELL